MAKRKVLTSLLLVVSTMMKLALLASTLSAAAAFAPASQQSARVATVVEAVPEYWDADYSKEPGVTAPVSFMCLQQLTIIL